MNLSKQLEKVGINFTPFPHLFTEDAYMQLTIQGKTYEELSEPMQLFYDALYVGEEYFFTPLPVLNTEAYTEKQAQIFPNLESLVAQCVTGEITVDEFYNQYEKLKPIGLQDILDQGNEAMAEDEINIDLLSDGYGVGVIRLQFLLIIVKSFAIV